jgi:hypothetical protein
MEKPAYKEKRISVRKQLSFIDAFTQERTFLTFILILFIIAALVYQNTAIAMWFGFAVAGYSVVSNDSIQTIGTFLSSNAHRKWWILWLYIGGLFILTILVSYFLFDGDISYRRLATKGFDQDPVSFELLHLIAPIILIIITRMRMPVSTTFLLLSSFATSSGAISQVLTKSLVGYGLAFSVSFLTYLFLARYLKARFKGKAHDAWHVTQWITTGTLWCLWIMQDAANIAVFLPRKLDLWQLMGATGIIFLGLGVIFYHKGGRIQEIITNKSDVVDVRPATVIDFIFSLLMLFHLVYSTVPMSTTWVFLGLLGGREIAMRINGTSHKTTRKTLKIIGKDILLALIGLTISIVVAFSVNDIIRAEILAWFR